MDCLVRSYQGYRPGALVLAGSGRRLATPQRAWGYRRSDTARPRLHRFSLQPAEVRRRVTSGRAAATPGGGDERASQSSGCVADPWAEHAARTGAGTLPTSGSWHGTYCDARSPSNERRRDRHPLIEGDDSRWPLDGYSGPGTEAHALAHQREPWHKRPSLPETECARKLRMPSHSPTTDTGQRRQVASSEKPAVVRPQTSRGKRG